MPSLACLSIEAAHELLQTKQISCVELVQYYLDRIKQYDEKIHAVLTLCDTQALTQAKKIDEKIAAKEEIGVLEGIPYVAKDLFLTKGIRTTAASKILEHFIPPYSATVIEKLESVGAILLAKTNTDEFAQGGSTENSAFGPTKNPWNTHYVPGGTSGGSAAAVAADFCVFALGTDTGGSIRQPAAYCGITGLKPTYGLVSRYGVVAAASSLDTIGPLTRSAQDAAVVLSAIAGQDTSDATTITLEDSDFTHTMIDKPKIGLLKAETQLMDQIESSLDDLGWSHTPITSDQYPSDEALTAYYIINPSEISSNLERYDGIRYGEQNKDATNTHDTYTKTRQEFLGAEIKRRILLGTYSLSAGYYDAYYKKAMQVRTKVIQKYEKLFESCDVIVAPVTLGPAFELGSKTDPVEMYQVDILTVAVNLAGLPSVCIPAAIDENTGLPLGIQIIGKQKDDAKVLAVAREFQNKTNWHTKVEEITL